jgi:hypothetical protein
MANWRVDFCPFFNHFKFTLLVVGDRWVGPIVGGGCVRRVVGGGCLGFTVTV